MNNYQKRMNEINKKPLLRKSLTIIATYSPYITVISYGLLIISELIEKKSTTIKIILIPGITFIITSILRKLINRKRPFEVYDYLPLIAHSNGETFPSRHTASAFIITYAFYYINHPCFYFLLVVSFIIALTRVLTGVHNPSDVIAAILLSLVCGYLGFYIF